MEDRDQKIINYFIVLQLMNFNRDKTIHFFNEYFSILNKPLINCIFEIKFKDKKIFDLLTPKIEQNAFDVLNKKKNGEILFYDDKEFPEHLKKIEGFPPVIFYRGNINLLESISISVVGTRKPSNNAVNNAKRISRYLIKNSFSITSGLALGVDSIVHDVAKSVDYKSLIGVLGTPINISYPKVTKVLQDYIKHYGLMITEYPHFENVRKWNFVRRNFIMSAISFATIVIEAGDTSGTVSQARSTLKNNRPLFVPENVFVNPQNSWPTKFINDYGNVHKFSSFEDLNLLFSKYINVKKRG